MNVREGILDSLNSNSPLLMVLRALYSLRLEVGVLLRESARTPGPLVFSKDHLAFLIERAAPETPAKDLDKLAGQGLFRPLEVEDGDRTEALVLEGRGAWVAPLEEAMLPREPDYPDWWEAPLPFVLRDRGRVHANRTAQRMFGPDLERLSAPDFPDRDEFLVELEGRETPYFLTFRRLEPDVFILEDSTGDLLEAQELSWWAAVGKAWTNLLDEEGRHWRRADSPNAGEKGYPCEWKGRFWGFLCVAEKSEAVRRDAPKPRPDHTSSRKRRKNARREPPKREDKVLKAIGPQTMGLLTAGQIFEGPGDAAPKNEAQPKAGSAVSAHFQGSEKKER